MRRIALLLLLVFILPACTEVELASHVAKQIPIPGEKQSVGHFKVGTPYRIAGQKYYPQESYSFTETGIASWYGPNFHGKQTANGEIFDKFELTAAHRTLQMPSIARVTNLENGRSIVVRINDRGPFKKNRVIDLSERAAELLDFKHKGTTKVKVDVMQRESKKVANLARQGQDTRGVEVAMQDANNPIVRPKQKPFTPTRVASAPPPRPLAKPISDKGIFVQTGAFGDKNNAVAMAHRLESYGQTNISKTVVNGNPVYRVRLGPFANTPQADSMKMQLATSDIPNPILIVE